jgi:magnesium chelatase family protein
MRPEQLAALGRAESSDAVARRVLEARAWSLERNGGVPNSAIGGQRLVRACGLDASSRKALDDLATSLELTARGVHRLMRVARTIADLRGLAWVSGDELASAAALRDRSMEQELAA